MIRKIKKEIEVEETLCDICEDCFSDLTIKDLTEEFYKRNGGHITK